MKSKTEKIICRTVISAVLTVAAVLAIIACAPVVGPGDAGKGAVTIRLGVDPAVPDARTLVPSALGDDAFDAYDLDFTVVVGGTGTAQNFTDVTSLTVSLDPGKYDLALTAKKGGVATATGEYKNITVTEGASTPVTVPLVFKSGAGDGTLSFKITRPSDFDLSDAQFVLTPLFTGGTTYGTDWLYILYNGEKKVTQSSDETIASGYYRATVTLSTPDQKAVKTDIVHIGAGRTTTLDWTFTAANFSTIVEDIWVVGVMDTWTLPGTPMTLASNGTFIWEGEILTDDPAFRFSLTNTTGWNDKWNGNWFAPSITQTPGTRQTVAVGSNIPMEFAPTNTAEGVTSATESAWKMSAPGYYRLTVNPYAKTFNIEAPVVVTGVAITGGNVSINKGSSHEFSATVAGHNSPSQVVTWSITTSSVASGTAFDGNNLTIDANETAASLTIRATSTADSAKYAEITVAVQDAASPVVTSITVSAAGNAAEVSRDGTLQFSAVVTAANGATQAVTWTVNGKDKDGNSAAIGSGTSISNAGLLTVGAGEAAVDLVVRAASQQTGFDNVCGEAAVFVRKLGSVFLIGDEFGGWATGTTELTYDERGVYTTTQLMSKNKSFRFTDNSSNSNYFEPYPDGQSPSGTVDAWQHLSSDGTHTRTAWTIAQGGRYEISLDTVTEKVAFTVIAQVITITAGPSALAPGENGTFTYTTTITDAPVTWKVYGDDVNGHVPQSGTQISDGTLTLGSGEWIGHKLYVTATSLGETVESGNYPALGVPVIDPNVYIVGFMNTGGNWNAAGDLMVRGNTNDTKHLFTWTGSLSGAGDFRMHRGGGSDWSRPWFVPTGTDESSNRVYGINSGHRTDLAVDRWGDTPGTTERKWQITGWSSGSTYTISFNAATRKLSVTQN